MSVLCVFACLLVVALAQPGPGQEYWQANFIQTAGATQSGTYGGGQNAGVMRFNWPNKLFSITFGANVWAETYAYNINRGYPPDPVDPTAALQTRSSVGTGCTPACGISRITTAMPPLAPSLGSTYMTTTVQAPCTKYTPTGANQMVSYFTASGTGAACKICSVVFKDGRVFQIDPVSFQWTNVAIPIPTGCTCDQKMDIWILVDHSSSINDVEMVAFKSFVQQFLNSLTISPTGINVGMSWFHYKTGINFNITGSLTNINAAMLKWWTNCSTAASSQYCIDNPTDAGCAGCQQSGTSTATAIQGYKGPTTSLSWPGTMDVTGAMTNFYDTNHGGSARVVPKMFLTLTDGAMNTYLDERNGIDGCTFSQCTPDLTAAVAALRATHNSKFPSMSLTTISMGIGVTGTDPNLSLSIEHLLTLAEQHPENTFTAPTFDATLSNYLKNLLLLSCPATNDIVQDTCLQSCCGLCVCGTCKAPSSCYNFNNCTQQVLQLCCNEIAAPIAGVCPTVNRCTNAICDPTLEDGDGACVYTNVNCSSFTNGCTRYSCTPSTGQCTTADTSQCPPVPCTWGPWSAWTACSVTCGTGVQTQSRSVNQSAANGGPACTGPSSNSTACVVSGCCPVSCTLSSWTQWTACGQCGVGNQTRSRSVTRVASCGGTDCSTDQDQSIFCPACINRNCSGYNTTGNCNCAAGTNTITFTINQQQSGNGLPCLFPDGTVWTVPCTTTQLNACPHDCVEAWSSWTLCDCNYDTQNRSYSIFSRQTNGGRACAYPANFSTTQACTPTPQQNCPLYGPQCNVDTDCTDSFACTQDLCLLKPDGLKHCDWRTPTVCAPNFCLKNNTCDNTLGCVKTLKSLSVACPFTPCNLSVCDQTANGGQGGCVYTPVNCSGVPPVGCQTWSCDPTKGTCSKANRTACPAIDCQWGAWGQWSSCSKTCGGGTTTQSRSQNQTAMDGGLACVGSATNTTGCNSQCCPVDCAYSGWSSWSACSLCSLADRNRTRTVRVNDTCGGVVCNLTSLFDSQQCPPCTPQNCSGRNITGPCNCTADGLGGSTIYTFIVVNQQVGNGTACALPDGFTWVDVCTAGQIASCPRPCIESFSPADGNWSTCDCYNFTQYKDYKILQPPSNGGKACSFAANFTQWQACTPASNCTDIGPPCVFDADCNDELACTVDKCILFTPPGTYHCAWVARTDCNSTNICQTGYCDQTVGCRRQNLTSDVACPPPDLCTTSFCNVSAGANGSCIYAPKNCSAFADGCQDYLCDLASGDCALPSRLRCPPIDCTYGDWGQWSSCGASCGNSTQTRTRGINRTAADGGANCTGNTTDVQNCFAGCCPVDCVLTPWTQWSQAACTLCGTEKQTRNRTVSVPAQCGGVACGNLTDDSLQCPPCAPVNCVGHNMTLPCNCSADGTAGTHVKIFVVDTAKVGTGLDCPFADATNWTEACNATEINGCPKPCIEGYSNYTVCDCFNSSQSRDYYILQQPLNGGKPCSYPANFTQNQTCTPSANCPNLGPVCVNASDCNDGLACTVDRCILFTPPGTYHCDWSVNLTCNDSSVCTSDRCDQLLGCVYTPALFCEDNNNCTIDTCDPILGCTHTNVTCPDYDVCQIGTCSPITGCGITQRNCSANITVDNCTLVYCDVNYTRNGAAGPCATQNVCASTAILAIGIGAGIIAAIIILALLALALCSGGAYAAATNMSHINENAVQVNPLYHGAGYEADNPLFGGGAETV